MIFFSNGDHVIGRNVIGHAHNTDGVLLAGMETTNTVLAIHIRDTTLTMLGSTDGKNTLLGDGLTGDGADAAKSTEGHTSALHGHLQSHTFLHSHTGGGLLELILLKLVLKEVFTREQLTEDKGTVLAGHLIIVVASAAEREKDTLHILVLLHIKHTHNKDLVYDVNTEGRELLVGEVQTVGGRVEDMTFLNGFQSVRMKEYDGINE